MITSIFLGIAVIVALGIGYYSGCQMTEEHWNNATFDAIANSDMPADQQIKLFERIKDYVKHRI